MKRDILKTFLALSICFQASAALALPEEIEAFIGKVGKYVALRNGDETRLSGGTCKVVLNSSKEAGTTIAIDAPGKYQASAKIEKTQMRVAGNGAFVFTTMDSNVSGDEVVSTETAPAVGYRKTVEIKDNAIVIRQKFSRGFYQKNDLMSVCDLN